MRRSQCLVSSPAILTALLMMGCSQQPNASTLSESDASPTAQPDATTPVDDGLSTAPDAYVAELKGHYHLWEDVEGGRVCDVTLEDSRTIGGYAVTADDACVAKLETQGDLFAWFIRDDGAFVFIDATRQPLLTLEALQDGSFYLRRHGQQSLNLTPANIGSSAGE